MKKVFRIFNFLAFALLSNFAVAQGHCSLSDLFLDEVTNLGNNEYQIDLTFCTKGGSDGYYDGESQNTYTFGFWISGGATFISSTDSLISPQTGAVYHPYLGQNDTALAYTDMTYPLEWWTCIDGNCGAITTYCSNVSLITSGLPESVVILGLEGGGNPEAGCQGYRVTVYPGNNGPDCDALAGTIATDKTTLYQGWAPESCANLSASATGGSGNYHYVWSNGDCVSSIEVCPNETTTYTVTITDQDTGCQTTSAITIQVEDIRCGRRNNKVIICQNGTTRCVSQSKVAQKLANGATLGPCNNYNDGGSDHFSVFSETATATNTLTVYPNPVIAITKISFRAETTASYTLELFDISGRKVKTISNDLAEKGNYYQQDFARGNLNAGIYLLKLSSDQGWIQTERLIIQ